MDGANVPLTRPLYWCQDAARTGSTRRWAIIGTNRCYVTLGQPDFTRAMCDNVTWIQGFQYTCKAGTFSNIQVSRFARLVAKSV